MVNRKREDGAEDRAPNEGRFPFRSDPQIVRR